jgi:ferredoxin
MAKKNDRQTLPPETVPVAAATSSSPPSSPPPPPSPPPAATSSEHAVKCSNCGSCRRTKPVPFNELEYAGLDENQQPFTHYVWSRSNCLDCNQGRTTKSTENRTTK